MSEKSAFVLANFGGPRNVAEIEDFLTELLCDQDVVRTEMRPFFHRMLFRRIAKKRTKKVVKDYEVIGGKSPIWEETESLATFLEERLKTPVIPFHRYLPKTHADFFKKVEKYGDHTLKIFPLFPQFSYATTGSIARYFSNHLPQETISRLRWVKSYASHPKFIALWVKKLKEFIQKKGIDLDDSVLIFSAHGVPVKFIESQDLYLDECERSYKAVMEYFPQAKGALSFQSKFGPGKWLEPSTEGVCQNILSWNEGRKNALVIPISFTSDHIETLYEIEHLYLPILKEKGVTPYRIDAFEVEDSWRDAIINILKTSDLCNNAMLVRQEGCKTKCPSCKKRCKR